jgi:acetylglutamate kinase
MIVIKFGGHAMGASAYPWMEEISTSFKKGQKFVIVHGGGPQINKELERQNIVSQFHNGLRITTPEVMTVVESVLAGSVLREVVRNLSAHGLPAIGITGGDAGLLKAEVIDNGELGAVGEVVKVEPKILHLLLENGYLPVVSPLSQGPQGQVLNVNADLAAGSIAGSLAATEIIFLTDVPGIYRNWPDEGSLIAQISREELRGLNFADGMIPKVQAALQALQLGARSVRIIDGKNFTAFQQALLGRGGTWVHP